MKTASEQLFETYLVSHGFKEFDHEAEIAGATRRPDYRVRIVEAEIFFEVKEFEPPEEFQEGGAYDPYAPIRSKINEAQKQLRALKGQMCGIVLANPHGAFIDLESMAIYGAMLGNLGITMPYDEEADAYDFERATQTFLAGGKMIRYKHGQAIAPQNTTISAVCVLGTVAESSRRFAIRVANLMRETGQSDTLESIWETALEMQDTEADAALDPLRIQVYENPYAVAPLVETFGTGPWDERFGVRNGRFLRVFAGSSLMALEADEHASGVERPDPLGL
jgi:hypothetical protein